MNVIGYLLEHGADVDVKNDDGWTPLYVASINGFWFISFWIDNVVMLCIYNTDRVDTVEFLLEHGADINVKAGGWSPLLVASLYGEFRKTWIHKWHTL